MYELYCEYCGGKNKDEALNCRNCSAPISKKSIYKETLPVYNYDDIDIIQYSSNTYGIDEIIDTYGNYIGMGFDSEKFKMRVFKDLELENCKGKFTLKAL